MKNKDKKNQDELEQFKAYDEYSYDYRHSTGQPHAQTHKHKRRVEPETQNEPMANPMVVGAYEQPEYHMPSEPELSPQERARIRFRSITGRLIFLVLVLLLMLIVLQKSVFRLNTVYVIGNEKKTAQEIATTSGLVKGLNIFAISENEVRKNLSNDHTLIFLGMQKDFPSTIYLYVAERQAVSSTQWLGLLYTLDAQGIVMSEDNTTQLPSDMPTVTGWQITSIHVGQMLEVREAEQLLAYFDIMNELALQFYGDQITEINLVDTDNIYLQTTTGISVRVGDRKYIRAKIGALRTDIAYLQQLGKSSGVLDVSIPEDGKYRPES